MFAQVKAEIDKEMNWKHWCTFCSRITKFSMDVFYLILIVLLRLCFVQYTHWLKQCTSICTSVKIAQCMPKHLDWKFFYCLLSRSEKLYHSYMRLLELFLLSSPNSGIFLLHNPSVISTIGHLSKHTPRGLFCCAIWVYPLFPYSLSVYFSYFSYAFWIYACVLFKPMLVSM